MPHPPEPADDQLRPFTVYVPQAGRLPQVDPGAGIVGTPIPDHPGKILIDFEANRSRTVNLSTYADRVHHAAERHRAQYPTSARALVDQDDLLWVGIYHPAAGLVETGNSEPLESWLQQADPAGELPDLDIELRISGPSKS